jgi:hypothetical protein
MKRVVLTRNAILAVALAAVGLGGGGSSARAAVITLDVSASLTPNFPARCSPSPCTIGGTIVINNGTGAIISENVTTRGFSPSVSPFTSNEGVLNRFGDTLLKIDDSASNHLNLIFETPTAGSLVGYTGGPLLTDGTVMTNGSPFFIWGVNSGSLTAQSAVPEPSIWAMMIFGFCGLAFMAKRKKNSPHFA